jgi:tRNA pseudouridine38-40 synthase
MFPINPYCDDELNSGTTQPEENPSARRNIMLTIAYDGTVYRGWQVQPNGLSVQECVERAVQRLTGESLRVFCAGRTDAGVHAIGQVANFHTDCNIPIENVRRGLQCYLPEDITIVSVADVESAFHATYSAVRKRYRYVICDSDVAPPFLNRFVHRCRFHLDVDLMAEATQYLLGTHDFRCFETQYPNKSSSVRNIMEATIQRVEGWQPWSSPHDWNPVHGRPYQNFDRPLIVFEVMADGFLYNMVRAIVGTLMEVGRRKYEPQFVGQIIQSQNRAQAGITAPAEGLYLVKVDYPELLLRRGLSPGK